VIKEEKKVFQLDTKNTSYIFAISPQGHPIHIYYGSRLPQADVDALQLKNNITLGSTVDYAPGYNLDSQLLEYSGIGKGDYRHAPLECMLPDGSFTTDFVYEGHRITEGSYESDCHLSVVLRPGGRCLGAGPSASSGPDASRFDSGGFGSGFDFGFI
jgi:alpha-galactosidase